MTAAVTVEPILPPSFPSAKYKHLQEDASLVSGGPSVRLHYRFIFKK